MYIHSVAFYAIRVTLVFHSYGFGELEEKYTKGRTESQKSIKTNNRHVHVVPVQCKDSDPSPNPLFTVAATDTQKKRKYWTQHPHLPEDSQTATTTGAAIKGATSRPTDNQYSVLCPFDNHDFTFSPFVCQRLFSVVFLCISPCPSRVILCSVKMCLFCVSPNELSG